MKSKKMLCSLLTMFSLISMASCKLSCNNVISSSNDSTSSGGTSSLTVGKWEVVTKPTDTEKGTIEMLNADGTITTFELPALNNKDYAISYNPTPTCQSNGKAICVYEKDNQRIEIEVEIEKEDTDNHVNAEIVMENGQEKCRCISCHKEIPVQFMYYSGGGDYEEGFYAYGYNGTPETIVIPKTVKKDGVTYSDIKVLNQFSNCTSLEKLSVYDNSSTYDSRNNCNAIIETATNTLVVGCKNTVIPNSVTSIGQYAFNHCSGLKSIDIPNNVTSIGQEVFVDCTSLETVKLPNSITSIEYRTFQRCSALKLIDIPSGVTSIGEEAFFYCTALEMVELPNSLTSIGEAAFIGCAALKSIDIPSGVTSIGEEAFDECSSLESIDIPSGVTSIGYQTFGSCNALTSVKLPNGLTTIENMAFYNCTSLESIEIPNSVTNFGESPDTIFEGCNSLKSIIISPTSLSAMTDSYTSEGCFNDIKDHLTFFLTNKIDTDLIKMEQLGYSFCIYSENQPTDATYSYWHYDESGNPVKW